MHRLQRRWLCPTARLLDRQGHHGIRQGSWRLWPIGPGMPACKRRGVYVACRIDCEAWSAEARQRWMEQNPKALRLGMQPLPMSSSGGCSDRRGWMPVRCGALFMCTV